MGHKCKQDKNLGDGVAQIFAKIPGESSLSKQNCLEESSFGVLLHFYLEGLLKFALNKMQVRFLFVSYQNIPGNAVYNS